MHRAVADGIASALCHQHLPCWPDGNYGVTCLPTQEEHFPPVCILEPRRMAHRHTMYEHPSAPLQH